MVALGTGTGVANIDPTTKQARDYLYKGFALTECDGIVRSLLMHNYGSNDLTKSNPLQSTFNEVKSDHWYDTDKDGKIELVAWILDGSESPYQGQYGMMKEFASGNRSSTGYCSHDFQLTTFLIYNTMALGICDVSQDDFADKNGVKLTDAIYVGNEDFLYKNEIGYQGYATGSYGESTSSHSEANEGPSYHCLKALWRNTLMPLFAPEETPAE